MREEPLRACYWSLQEASSQPYAGSPPFYKGAFCCKGVSLHRASLKGPPSREPPFKSLRQETSLKIVFLLKAGFPFPPRICKDLQACKDLLRAGRTCGAIEKSYKGCEHVCGVCFSGWPCPRSAFLAVFEGGFEKTLVRPANLSCSCACVGKFGSCSVSVSGVENLSWSKS